MPTRRCWPTSRSTAGWTGTAALQAIADPARHAEVEALEAQAQGWGISGVPTFIFERRYAFSGAQPLEVFLDAMDTVERERVAAGGPAGAGGAAAGRGGGAAR